MTAFKVIFFRDNKGHCPVDEYIKKLSTIQQNKVFAYIKRLEEVGFNLRRPAGDYLGEKTGLYELRSARHRILYYFHERKYIILLHAFLKTTVEIPEAEIEKASFKKEICEVMFKHGLIDLGE